MPWATIPNTNTNSLQQHTMMESANYIILQSEQQIRGHIKSEQQDWKQKLKKEISNQNNETKNETETEKDTENETGNEITNQNNETKNETDATNDDANRLLVISCEMDAKYGPRSGTYGLHLHKPRSFAH